MIHNLQKSAKETHFDKNISGLNADNVQGAIDELKGTVGDTSKNILNNTAKTTTTNGLTFTVNNDKSVTVNGTATADTTIDITYKTATAQGLYIYSGCPKGGSDSTYKMQLIKYNNNTYVWSFADYGEGVGFNASDVTTVTAQIFIAKGYTANNLVFKPMIRPASIKDDTYEPYVPNIEDILYFKKGETLSISDVVLCTGVMAHNGCIYFSIPMPKNLKNISTISMSCSKMFIRSVIGEKTLTNFSGYAFTFYPENNVLSAEIRDVTSLGITKGTPVAIAGVFNFTFN